MCSFVPIMEEVDGIWNQTHWNLRWLLRPNVECYLYFDNCLIGLSRSKPLSEGICFRFVRVYCQWRLFNGIFFFSKVSVCSCHRVSLKYDDFLLKHLNTCSSMFIFQKTPSKPQLIVCVFVAGKRVAVTELGTDHLCAQTRGRLCRWRVVPRAPLFPGPLPRSPRSSVHCLLI